jgi:hypothetical protein
LNNKITSLLKMRKKKQKQPMKKLTCFGALCSKVPRNKPPRTTEEEAAAAAAAKKAEDELFEREVERCLLRAAAKKAEEEATAAKKVEEEAAVAKKETTKKVVVVINRVYILDGKRSDKPPRNKDGLSYTFLDEIQYEKGEEKREEEIKGQEFFLEIPRQLPRQLPRQGPSMLPMFLCRYILSFVPLPRQRQCSECKLHRVKKWYSLDQWNHGTDLVPYPASELYFRRLNGMQESHYDDEKKVICKICTETKLASSKESELAYLRRTCASLRREVAGLKDMFGVY